MYILYASYLGYQRIIGMAKTEDTLATALEYANNAGDYDVISYAHLLMDYPVLVLDEPMSHIMTTSSQQVLSYGEFKAIAESLQRSPFAKKEIQLIYFDRDWVEFRLSNKMNYPFLLNHFYSKYLTVKQLREESIPTLFTLATEKACEDGDIENLCQLLARSECDLTITSSERKTLFECFEKTFRSQLYFKTNQDAAVKMLNAMKGVKGINLAKNQGFYHFAQFKIKLEDNNIIDRDLVLTAITYFNKLPNLGHRHPESAEYYFDLVAEYFTSEALKGEHNIQTLWELYEAICFAQLQEFSTPYYWALYLACLISNPPVGEAPKLVSHTLNESGLTDDQARCYNEIRAIQRKKISTISHHFEHCASRDDDILRMLIEFHVKTFQLLELKCSPNKITSNTTAALIKYILEENSSALSEVVYYNIAHTYLDFGKKLQSPLDIERALEIQNQFTRQGEQTNHRALLLKADTLRSLASLQVENSVALEYYLLALEKLNELINFLNNEHSLFDVLIQYFEEIYLAQPKALMDCLQSIDKILNIHDSLVNKRFIYNPHLIRLRISLYRTDMSSAKRHFLLSLLNFQHGCDQETRNLIAEVCQKIGDTSLLEFSETETAFLNQNYNKYISKSDDHSPVLTSLTTEQLLEMWQEQKDAIAAQPVSYGW